MLCALLGLFVAATPVRADQIIFESSYGNIVVELYTECTTAVNNFRNYTDNDLFDNLVVQYSNTTPLVTGGAGSIVWAGSIRQDPAYVGGTNPFGLVQSTTLASCNDLSQAGLPSVRGTITMAQTGTGDYSNGFFFNITDNLTLGNPDPGATSVKFTTFGEVVQGMDILDAIFAMATNGLYGSYPNMPYDDVDSSGTPEYGELVVFNDVQVVPEPTTLSLLALGGAALLARRRRK
jgi:peptidyl-prolyl cis-trans isomerase B (cyclophilin B)